MASITLSVVGCIDYLAYGTIFTRVTFRPKIKLDVFFFRQKSPNERREVVLNALLCFGEDVSIPTQHSYILDADHQKLIYPFSKKMVCLCPAFYGT